MKLLLIYSPKNRKLLLLNIVGSKIEPISSNDFYNVYRELKLLGPNIKNEQIVQIIREQNCTDIIEVDHKGLVRIGDIYALICNEHINDKIIKVCFGHEQEKVIYPEKFSLIIQDVGYYGEIYVSNLESNLKFIKLYSGFNVYIYEDEVLVPLCSSLFIKMDYNGKGFTMRFMDEISLIGNSTTTGITSELKNPLDLLEYIIANLGVSFEISSYEFRDKDFLCVLPIEGFLLEDVLGLGIIEFLPRERIVEEKIFLDLLKISESDVFAKIYINTDSYSKAYKEATEIINKGIDFLYHINRYDTLFLDGDNFNPYWDRNFYQKISISKEVLIIDTLTSEYICASNDGLIEKKVPLNVENIEKSIELLEWYEKYLTDEMDRETKKSIKTIFIAIRYIRKSWDAKDLEDKLINTSVSYEFLLEDEKVDKLLDKEKRDMIATNAYEFVLNNFELEELAREVSDRIKYSLSSTILDQKFNRLITRLNIDITESEKLILKKIRDMRNKLVHGRGVPEIDLNLINKANGIISSLLLLKLKSRGN